ncbi:MAG: hypothetical protein KKD77_24585, partial [Gammaproteobacteria bacterium]|nr:hypothetical protein [Gammaproteobacteria bacterium]
MTTFELISSLIMALLTGSAGYLIKSVIEMPGRYVPKSDYHPEQYVLKTDCQRDSDRLYDDNKRAYQEISEQLKEINRTQGLILKELGKK